MMSGINKHRRLWSDNYTISIPLGERAHEFTLTVARDHEDVPQEIAFVGRGRSGAGLDQFLVELGIQVSRALQRRNPANGDPL